MARLSVAHVQLSCAIKGCSNIESGMFLDRHHVRSQKLFVHAFRRRRSKRYRAFVERYERFNQKDICRICRDHHERAHALYHVVIARHCWKLKLPLRKFSWKQAEILMDTLEQTFWSYKADCEKELAN